MREVDRERRLVGRRGEPVQVSTVLEGVVREGEERRGVVELDVAGEGRLSRREDGRSDGEKRDERARGGVRVEAAEAAKPQAETEHGEPDEQRHRELGCSR